jgi:hypothetical protein
VVGKCSNKNIEGIDMLIINNTIDYSRKLKIAKNNNILVVTMKYAKQRFNYE